MELTLTEAAKETGRTRSAIFKSIKSGRLSARKDDNGEYRIDASELFRVYQPAKQEATQDYTIGNGSISNGLIEELKVLRERLSGLETLTTQHARERDLLSNMMDDLKKDRDHWRQQATHLLEHKQSADMPTKGARKPVEAPKGFLGMFSRRRA